MTGSYGAQVKFSNPPFVAEMSNARVEMFCPSYLREKNLEILRTSLLEVPHGVVGQCGTEIGFAATREAVAVKPASRVVKETMLVIDWSIDWLVD